MINKKVISDIVSKYSLGNNIEKVKWIITDEKFIIHFINDSKNLVGYVDYRKDIGLKQGDYGIFNTSQLIKCLNILDGDILVDATTSKLNMADTNYDIKFNLADPAVIPNVPDVSNNEDEWSVTFEVSDEFITRFVKSKDALSDLETFTVETRDGFHGEELVFTVGTNITNTIEFTVENANINESFEAIPFDSNLMKEILKANKDYHSGEIRINKKGLLDAHLHHGDSLYTGYYLVRKQEKQLNMNEETKQQVTEYVYKNYKQYKDKPLIIRELDNCFHVLKHEDGSPLILGKGIVNN